MTEEIKDFVFACDNMANSKFILVDKRIGDLLKSIATTKSVYNAIAENMINFNFASAYKFATAKNGEITIPEDRLIAFVFCLLKNIDNGNINVNELLVKHFPSDDDKRSSYVVFCEKTIIPFKNQIVEKVCGKSKQKATDIAPKKQKKQNSEVLERLEFLVKDVKTSVSGIKKLKGSAVSKQQYLLAIDTFLAAIANNDEKYYMFFINNLIEYGARDKELNRRLNAILQLLEEIKE